MTDQISEKSGGNAAASGATTLIPDGRALEDLVVALETAFSDIENVRIERRKRLRDRTSKRGRKREFDVVVAITEGHHELFVAFECRDRKRPVTIEQVDAFWKKCQDCGVHSSIIVSRSGFYVSAQEKAEQNRVRCMTVTPGASFSWLSLSDLLLVVWTPNSNFTLVPLDNSRPKPREFLLVKEDGTEITGKQLNNAVVEAWDDKPPTEETSRLMRFSGYGCFVKDIKTGEMLPLSHIDARVSLKKKAQLLPFKLDNYTDLAGAEPIAESASVDVSIGPLTGKIVLVNKKDKGTHLLFVPRRK